MLHYRPTYKEKIYKSHPQNTPSYMLSALHYKPEGRGFHSRWCHWNFSLT